MGITTICYQPQTTKGALNSAIQSPFSGLGQNAIRNYNISSFSVLSLEPSTIKL